MITEEIASDYLVGKTATLQKSETTRSSMAVHQSVSRSSKELHGSVEKQQSKEQSMAGSRHSSKKHRVTAVRRQSRVTSTETRASNSLKVISRSKRSKTHSSRKNTTDQDAKSLEEPEVILDKTHSEISLKKDDSECVDGEAHIDGNGKTQDEDANQELEASESVVKAENPDVEGDNKDGEVEADKDIENQEVKNDFTDDVKSTDDAIELQEKKETEENIEAETNAQAEDTKITRLEENGDDVPSDKLLRVMSSSDNETTYLPVVSVSSGTGSIEDPSYASSSAKENDGESPEFSSHWTEEYTSSEVSDSELADDSFQEKFIAYKSSLLDDDEDASSEGETCNDNVNGDSEVTDDTNNTSQVISEEILKAFEMGDLDKFKELLKSDNQNIAMYVDELGRNLLHIAASKGYVNFVEELVNYGLRLESCTSEGYTALHLAILNNHLKCCQVLLENGASLSDGEIPEKVDAASPVKRFLTKYEENLGRVKKLSEVLNHFGKKSKTRSSGLSKNLLRTLTDLSLEDDDEERSDTSAL